MIRYVNVFDMPFIGHVLHNFSIHDNITRFSYVHGLPCNVEMQIMCPAFHVHAMSSKFALRLMCGHFEFFFSPGQENTLHAKKCLYTTFWLFHL